jgi:hypothetical protein
VRTESRCDGESAQVCGTEAKRLSELVTCVLGRVGSFAVDVAQLYDPKKKESLKPMLAVTKAFRMGLEE